MEETQSKKAASFTGRARERKTRRHIQFFDRLAFIVITLGGIGTILAVGLVFVFLFSVAIPLFESPDSQKLDPIALSADSYASRPVAMGISEYRKVGWLLDSSADIVSFGFENSKILERRVLFPDRKPTAVRADLTSGTVTFGFEDGSFVLGNAKIFSEFVEDRDSSGAGTSDENAVLEPLEGGGSRIHRLEVNLGEAVQLAAPGVAIVDIDQVERTGVTTVVAVTANGTLLTKRLNQKRNLLLGKTVTTVTGGELAGVALRAGSQLPERVMLSGISDTVYLIWRDGHLVRVDTRNINSPVVAETINLFDEPGREVTSAEFMIGRTTLIVGDSLGGVQSLFRVKPDTAQTSDGSTLVQARKFFEGAGSPVTAVGTSARTRLAAVGFADGAIKFFQVTTGELLLEHAQGQSPPQIVSIAPKDDAVYNWSNGVLSGWAVDTKHPSVTLTSIFQPVWYEGYESQQHVWQSSSGEDSFEEKYGLAPLVFGTLKATLYSMLFGVPLALLAAIYTSEFLRPETRAKVKPTIEMMASLPSVVLGFLAALVIAPVFEGMITEFLTAMVVVPIVVVFGGYLWQLCPSQTAVRLSRFRLWFVFLALGVGALASGVLGPVVERLFFAGDIRAWLDGQVGNGVGGWMMLTIPMSVLFTVVVMSRLLQPRFGSGRASMTRHQLAIIDIKRFAVGLVIALGSALAISILLTTLGLDPRGSFVDTFVQRNALVVGFVMGFAIIPIIYTIADDALTSVPDHLRAASLGCGATPWQTALRIIIPTAMSGLFSAVMIGLGRAVGETMIVLMAAGNTPVMEWNIFNGFRTLSANIAVELPEAVQGGTHYRMLFLAALTLFLMTFVVNTIAEVVRQRFRKRAFAL